MSQIFKDYLKLDEQGYIVTHPGTTKTSIDGVFASGDIQDKTYKGLNNQDIAGCQQFRMNRQAGLNC